ncbi:hypothetical protein FQA39_LY06520 [Lamprigera yunnana]|nr:hypothetical protein FQA39_LY06520 [Lamprigera yunnana]
MQTFNVEFGLKLSCRKKYIRIPPHSQDFSRETSFNVVPHDYNSERYQYHDYQDSFDSCSCSSSSSSSSKTFRNPWCICLVVCIIVAALGIGLGLPLALNPQIEFQTTEQRLVIVRRLLKETPLIDGHNDLAWNIRKYVHNKLIGFNFSDISNKEPWVRSRWSHTDIPRMREGHLGAQFWSAYVPCGAQHLDAVQLTLEQIDTIRRLIDMNSRYFALVKSSNEILEIHKQGRIASLIGVEGGHTIGNSLAVLRMFYNLGARYLTITHTCDTPWAHGSNSQGTGGLTPFGYTVIKEMNRLGMIIDLSHSSVHTAKAALNASQAPVIFSHSSAYSICNSSRNVPDDVLKLVAHNGGVVMVNFYNYLITCNETATIHDVIKHINHIRKIAGIDHVGIGAGYDGINMTPDGLEDVSGYPKLLAELLSDPQWSLEDITLLAGKNILRVLSKVESIREQWRLAAIVPFEDTLPPQDTECNYKFS